MVMEKYPVTPKERNCRYEKQRNDALRNEYRKRLEQEKNTKRMESDKPEVRSEVV